MQQCDIAESEICSTGERYLAFIDETGDPFIHKNLDRYTDPTVFPVLTIAALVTSCATYRDVLIPAIDEIKMRFWGTRDIHLHSNEIRRKDGIFKVLLDDEKYSEFKQMMIGAFEKSSIRIVSSSINKRNLLERMNKFKHVAGAEYNVGDLYLTNVGWVFERLGHLAKDDTMKIVFETRGQKESRRIQGVLSEIKKGGTFYQSNERFKNISNDILFYGKSSNVNGIQAADYCSYPFARHAKNSSDDNALFDLLRKFVYKGDYGEYGLKEWP